MTNYIIRGFSGGYEYFRGKSTKQNRIPVLHSGFGDAITCLSNLTSSEPGNLLTAHLNSAYSKLMKMADIKEWTVTQDESLWEKYVSKSYDNESLEHISNRKCIQTYVEKDYIKLNPEYFKKVKGLPEEFITVQTSGFSKRARIDNPETLDSFIKSYNLPVINMNEMHKRPLEESAYIVSRAKYHVGVDSGSTHFALTIKDRSDVHICLNPKRLSEQGHFWIYYNYNVKLLT